MADALGIETRSRSRSKTPGVENGDSGKKAKKIPTISLIEEEDDVTEVAPSSQTRPKRQRRTKATVDTSGDVSVESPKSSSQKVVVTSTTTVTETVKKTTNGSEEATSTTTTTKSSKSNNVEEPESQSIFNNIFNAIKTSTPILNNKRAKRITYDVSSSSTANVNVAEHPAYIEYRDAGEYWNKFPKTDYTYSELSPHRRELTNGVVAMPNMSRRSLEKYNARVESMIHNNPLDETYLRRKFLANTNTISTSFQKRSADLQYDSADEVDVSELRRQLQARRKPVGNSVVSRFFLSIVSYLYSAYYSVKTTAQGVFGSKQSYAYTPVRRSKQGIFTRGFEAVKRFVLLGFSKVYLFVSTILCLDTWILYTRSENVGENRKRKRFLLALLILLPLLLLGGTYIYLDPPQNLSLPKISLPKLSFPKITLPSLPKLSLPSISWPTFSFPELSWPAWLTFNFTFSWPTISFEWLKFSRPQWLRFPDFTFSWPEFSFPAISFAWLKFSRPEWLKFPDLSFSWPEFSLPSISLPSFSLPSFSWPNISLPSLPSFSFDFSPYTGYVGDKFGALKSSSGEFFDKIREVTVGLLNEAQIVWNENFNAVSNAQPEVAAPPPPVASPPPVIADAI